MPAQMPAAQNTQRKTITLVVDRPWEPGTHAVITAELLDESEMPAVPGSLTCFASEAREAGESASQGDVLKRLVVKSVSRWFTTTDEGRGAWESTSENFNVGDLSTELGDGALTECLMLHGIASLDIETYSNNTKTSWEFDDVLVSVEAAEKLRGAE